MHIITESLKQLSQAALVYGFLIFGYSQVSDSAECGTFSTLYTSTTNGGSATYASSLFLRNGSVTNPGDCSVVMLTGDEYTNLIKNRIDTANINIQTLQNNDQTLQNNLQTVSTALNQLAATVQNHQDSIDLLTQKMNTNGLRDEDNFLHINHEDSMTFFYAVLGLFATAFVWRFARHSLSVAETSHASE
jgi:hypothetical protein